MNENNQQPNTLKSWVTGKIAMTIIGLTIAYFLYKSPLGQKLKDKLFAKKESE